MPQWQAEAPVAGDLESFFKISWSTLTGYCKQIACGMSFLEGNKVRIYVMYIKPRSFVMLICQAPFLLESVSPLYCDTFLKKSPPI